MKIRDLVDATGTTERQVRFLIAERFVPPPRGGRANADYGEDHVEAIRRYSRLRELGFPPAAIRLMLEAKEGVPFPAAPGVSLILDPSLLASGADPQPIAEAIHRLLSDVMKDNRKERKDERHRRTAKD